MVSTLLLEDTFFEKPQGGIKLTFPAVLGINASQHSQENTFTEVSFLKNIAAACNLILELSLV